MNDVNNINSNTNSPKKNEDENFKMKETINK